LLQKSGLLKLELYFICIKPGPGSRLQIFQLFTVIKTIALVLKVHESLFSPLALWKPWSFEISYLWIPLICRYF
jgi:hypothetical protein